MTKQEVIDLMKSSMSEEEWNHNVDKVKLAHSGSFPKYWFRAIILSGVASQVTQKWVEGGNRYD